MNATPIRSLTVEIAGIWSVVRDRCAAGAAAAVRGIAGRVAGYFQRHRLPADLASLDDRRLRDIGLSRHEIAFAAGVHPRHYDTGAGL